MSGVRANGARMLLLVLLVFSPYFAFLLWVFNTYGSNLPRWFGAVAPIYMVGGIWACVKLTPRIFNKQLNTLSPEVVRQSEETYGRPDFPPLTIEISYVSGMAHLKRFQALPWYAKQLGLGLGDFPTVAVSTLNTRRQPIVYFSRGKITLSPTEFKFEARQPVASWKSYSNLNTGLRFAFQPNEILSVIRFDMREVTSAPVRLPFLRIRTTIGELRDFLICSGSDDLSEIATETEELFFALQSFARNSRVAEARV
jgi:hypothetical protein